MIKLDDYLTCGGVCYTATISDELMINARQTIEHINAFLSEVAELRGTFKMPGITSGFRTPEYNEDLRKRGYHPALRSKHLQALACDLADHDGLLDAFCMDQPSLLEHHNLWFEHPAQTKGWCHLQIVAYGTFRPGMPRWFYP